MNNTEKFIEALKSRLRIETEIPSIAIAPQSNIEFPYLTNKKMELPTIFPTATDADLPKLMSLHPLPTDNG